MKAFKSSKRLISVVLALTLLVLSSQCFSSAQEEEKKPLNIPEITLENLQVRGGSTSYLVDNPPYSDTAPTMRDFDFGPGSDNMENAYVVYDYGNEVMIESITLVGWWPKDQAVKNISIEYFSDGQWISAQENIQVPWVTSGATEEQVEIVLSEPVTTMKLRIKINSAYHSWSDKICMHLMRPNGYIVTEFKPLTDAIAQAQKLVSQVLIGDKGGEFSQQAVESLNSAVNEISSKLDQGMVSSEDIPVLVQQIEDAIEEFTSSQNPMENAPVPETENLAVSLGNQNYLTDRQISTAVTASIADKNKPAYIAVDFSGLSGKKLKASAITLLASASQPFTINISAEAELDGQWVEIAPESQLSYRCDVQGTEGHTISFDQCISSKFRLKISGCSAESFMLYEVLWDGIYSADTNELESLAQKAASLALNPQLTDYPDLLDILKISLAKAQNQQILDWGNQEKIDSISLALNEAIKAFDSLVSYQTGDVDHSGTIDINDATLIQKYIVKLVDDGESFDSSLADVDENGVINVNDATKIQLTVSKG